MDRSYLCSWILHSLRFNGTKGSLVSKSLLESYESFWMQASRRTGSVNYFVWLHPRGQYFGERYAFDKGVSILSGLPFINERAHLLRPVGWTNRWRFPLWTPFKAEASSSPLKWRRAPLTTNLIHSIQKARRMLSLWIQQIRPLHDPLLCLSGMNVIGVLSLIVWMIVQRDTACRYEVRYI